MICPICHCLVSKPFIIPRYLFLNRLYWLQRCCRLITVSSPSTNLSASLYYSVGRGGGTGDIGRLDGDYASSSKFRNPVNGQVNWDKIVASNSGQSTTFYDGSVYSNVVDPTTGLYIVNDQDETVNGVKRNGIVRRASINSHNFLGSIINLEKELNDNLTLNFGGLF